MTTRVDMIRARQAEAENTVSLDQEMAAVVEGIEELSAAAKVTLPEDLSPSEMVRALFTALVERSEAKKILSLEMQVHDLTEEKIKRAEPEAYRHTLGSSAVSALVDTYCRMACPGGSEAGTCSCTAPSQCERKVATDTPVRVAPDFGSDLCTCGYERQEHACDIGCPRDLNGRFQLA